MTFNQSSSSPTISCIDALSHIVQSRYNPELHFLNLESLDSDTHWKMANLESLNASHSKIGPVLCKMIAEKCPNVESISFANNRLKNLSSLSTLPERLPYLINLSFQNNSLLSLRDIDMMKGSLFQQLRELILLGNPLHDHSTRRPGAEIKYRSDIKKIFPTIKVLDQMPLAEEVTFNVDVMESTLPPVLSGFADSQMTVQTASDFVSK
jgi:nuclear RNA export factor